MTAPTMHPQKYDPQFPVIRFTADDVHGLLNAEIRRLYPELDGVTQIAAVVSEEEFIAVDVFVDPEDNGEAPSLPLGITVNPGLPTESRL